MTTPLSYAQYQKVVHAIAAHRTEQTTEGEREAFYYESQVYALYELSDADLLLLAIVEDCGLTLEDLK